MEIKMTILKLAATLRSNLSRFIGQKTSSVLKNEVQTSMNEMLASLNTQLNNFHSFEAVEVKTLWETFTFKEKLNWIWVNKLTSKSKKIKKEIDALNEKNLAEQGEDFDYTPYPEIVDSHPKRTMKATILYKLKTPINHLHFSFDLDSKPRK